MIKVGIICEYNPFHNGHKKQIDFIRRRFEGEDVCIVSIMSGNLTQRAEVAICDKHSRAEMALRCGADAVVELPFPYCSASADFFAFAGINILDKIGADYVCFGSESGDLDELSRCAAILASEKFRSTVLCIERENAELGGAAVAFKALGMLLGKDAPTAPNDILAISYLKHIMTSGSKIKPLMIRREGDYNSTVLDKTDSPSASAIRAALTDTAADVSDFMPGEAQRILLEAIGSGECTSQNTFREVLFHYYRFAPSEALAKCAEFSGGLENRISTAALESGSADEFFAKLPTKKYTDARLRRAMLFGITGVLQNDLRTPPAYVNLLAANATGREFISQQRKSATLPILAKPSDFSELGEAARRQGSLSLMADALFTLCKNKPADSGFYIRKSPKII